MPRSGNIISRYRWWILGLTSLVIFSLLSIIAIVIVVFEENTDNKLAPIFGTAQVKVVTPISTTDAGVTSITPSTERTIPSQTPDRELAFVQQVIDGDTIQVIINGAVFNLRYIGIDTPEIGMLGFDEATAVNKSLVEGQIVELESDVTNEDKYGRLLRYVYLPDGQMVNAQLVLLGLAAAQAYSPDTKYQSIFEANQGVAIGARIGLWAPTPTAPIGAGGEPSGNVQIDPSCSQFNAPGDDNQNKNKEYVCFVNTGPGNTHLLGWQVHDEYGWTYQFPDFILGSGEKVRVITGCGSDTASELYWCKEETAVWNNSGDCVYLVNADGNGVAQYCY